MTLEHFDTLLAFVIIITGVSLLVTTLTQMASTLFGLRGTHLHWGLKTLLTNIDPMLAEYAETIAQKVLHHPLISDSTVSDRECPGGLSRRWKLASAIRKDELIKILRMLAKPAGVEGRPGELVEPWRRALRVSLDRLIPETGQRVLIVVPEIKRLFADDPARAEVLSAQLISCAEQLSAEVGDWFDSLMDRVSERFAVRMRIWTVIFSIILAFGLQLDAFHLFTSLSSDGELRARLVSSAEVLTKKADDILSSGPGGGAGLYVSAMKQLIALHRDELRSLPEPSGFSNLTGAEEWLSLKLTAAGLSDSEKWAKAYEAQVPQASLRGAAENLNSLLHDKLMFGLFPDPYPEPFYKNWSPQNRIFWGILASAALLSLGAPFWFNMLKTLSNLRPVVANKEGEERTAEKK